MTEYFEQKGYNVYIALHMNCSTTLFIAILLKTNLVPKWQKYIATILKHLFTLFSTYLFLITFLCSISTYLYSIIFLKFLHNSPIKSCTFQRKWRSKKQKNYFGFCFQKIYYSQRKNNIWLTIHDYNFIPFHRKGKPSWPLVMKHFRKF